MSETTSRNQPKISRGARLAVLAAVAASLAVAIPSALAATAVTPGAAITPANGNEYLLPTGNLYQLGPKGVYHLVPDLPTATEMGVLWAQVKHVGSIAPIGQPLASVLTLPTMQVATVPPATMANGKDYVVPGGSIYQLDAKGVFHLIPDILTARAMKLDWGKLMHAKSVKPIGTPLRSVVVKVQRACKTKTTTAVPRTSGIDYILPNGNVYDFSKAMNHLIPDLATANAMGVDWTKLRRVKTISAVGAPIPSVCTG